MKYRLTNLLLLFVPHSLLPFDSSRLPEVAVVERYSSTGPLSEDETSLGRGVWHMKILGCRRMKVLLRLGGKMRDKDYKEIRRYFFLCLTPSFLMFLCCVVVIIFEFEIPLTHINHEPIDPIFMFIHCVHTSISYVRFSFVL